MNSGLAPYWACRIVDQLVAAVDIDIDEGDLGALIDEGFDDGGADAAAAAGHEHHLVLERRVTGE
jgi:hypothetical protein